MWLIVSTPLQKKETVVQSWTIQRGILLIIVTMIKNWLIQTSTSFIVWKCQFRKLNEQKSKVQITAYSVNVGKNEWLSVKKRKVSKKWINQNKVSTFESLYNKKGSIWLDNKTFHAFENERFE